MPTARVTVGSILTRSSGYLEPVCSHSLQPYRGCALGRSLCGVGCYVQHARHITKGRPWGGFLEARTNAADSYRAGFERERAWARSKRGGFSIFLSSSTEPFPPQERRERVTTSVLEAMQELSPDTLIVQTHSHLVGEFAGLLRELGKRCEVRVHLSIETDRERVPGLPPHASSVEKRFDAARVLRDAGLRVVITVSPLLPIEDPEGFFSRIEQAADGVVLDHFLRGDGTPTGSRTRRTGLPDAMAGVAPESVEWAYLLRMGEVAERLMPGRVGYHQEGFAGRFGMGPPPDPALGV